MAASTSLRAALTPCPARRPICAGNARHRCRSAGVAGLTLRPSGRARGVKAQALRGSGLRGSSLAKLQQQLDDAVAREDYTTAASIRDDLKQLERVSTLAIEEANAAFYRAFMDSDLEAMAEIWGTGDHVQCVHPWAGCIAGREEVMESWGIILGGTTLDIMLQDVRVHASESYGTVTCLEVMDGEDSRGRLVATNVFEKQDGKWVIVHHHASPAPRP